MQQRRSYAHRRLRSQLGVFLLDNVLPVALLIALYVLAVAVSRILGGRGYWQGFSNGFMLALLIGALLLLFLLHTGGITRSPALTASDEHAKSWRRGALG